MFTLNEKINKIFDPILIVCILTIVTQYLK